MTYPDGTKIHWEYDELLRPIQWERSTEGKADIRVDYRYDEAGRLREKKTSGGYRTRFDYNDYGQLCTLSHEDAGRREKELVKMVYDIGKTWSHKPPGKGME